MSRDDTRSLTKFDYPSTVTDDLAKSLKFRFFKASSDKKYTETRFSIKYFSIGHFRTVVVLLQGYRLDGSTPVNNLKHVLHVDQISIQVLCVL
jgi:hypothetical protein